MFRPIYRPTGFQEVKLVENTSAHKLIFLLYKIYLADLFASEEIKARICTNQTSTFGKLDNLDHMPYVPCI